MKSLKLVKSEFMLLISLLRRGFASRLCIQLVAFGIVRLLCSLAFTLAGRLNRGCCSEAREQGDVLPFSKFSNFKLHEDSNLSSCNLDVCTLREIASWQVIFC